MVTYLSNQNQAVLGQSTYFIRSERAGAVHTTTRLGPTRARGAGRYPVFFWQL